MNWLKSLNNKTFIIFFVILICSESFAQFAQYKQEFPDYNELVVSDVQQYSITIQDKKLKVISDSSYESMVLTSLGIQNDSEAFSYSELIKLLKYDAYTINNSNGNDKKIKVTQVKEKQADQRGIFYSNVTQKQLTFPNLEVGSRKYFSYQTELEDPFLMHKHIFASGLPIKNSVLEIKTDKEIELGYKIFNDPKNEIQFSKTEKSGKLIYKWSMANIKPTKGESNAPGYLYSIPHIDFFIKNYEVKKEKIQVLGSIDNLFNYYRTFTKNLNKTEDVTLKNIAQQITSNIPDEEQKVKTIFYWVKDNIKYIAFENGYEGFIPREASLVCQRKFGDCKDMASIISSMCNYVGIKNVTIAWIGTREIPYSYNELATPGVDNHMIAVYNRDNNFIFLDATDKETQYGIPTAFIQDKEAMVSVGDGYQIVKVPITKPNINSINEKLKLIIETEKIVGSSNVQYNGYNRSHTLMEIGDATNKNRFEKIKSLVLKGNNKFNLKKYEEQNIDNRDKPYIINYDFELDNYLLKIDNEIYLNLNLDKTFQELTIEKDRINKYEFDYLSQINTEIELKMPPNTTVKYLPKDFEVDNRLLQISIKYQNVNNQILVKSQIIQKKLLLENSDFELWNETTKKTKATYADSLILKTN